MNRIFVTATAFALIAGASNAGDLDQSLQPIGALFAPGNYAEFSLGYSMPSVTGVGVNAPTPGKYSGNMANAKVLTGFSIKKSFSDKLDAALIYDQPFGADISYPTGTGYYAAGTSARLNTSSLTGLLKYKVVPNFSVYGGLRYELLDAKANIVTAKGVYTLSVPSSSAFGYVAGIAYEAPEVGRRISLTYNSALNHGTTSNETFAGGPVTSSSTAADMPQSVSLDFQTAISKATQIFGSARWSNWSAFDYSPPVYKKITGGKSLISYPKDIMDYSLGVGHKFTDNWSGAATIGYQPSTGLFTGNLGPTDGNASLGLAAIYTQGKVKITGGVKYIRIGNAQASNTGLLASSNFTGNHAIAVGLKVGYSY
ncbi:MAG: hypothetical protein KGQ46_08410 [Hyphomicrobiales bacterium]|nr:hypothetical protein [Hyphomicrobiales bacterium]MDE2115172.1 hypothetical protein [Hyphomicrobiales bacterium]